MSYFDGSVRLDSLKKGEYFTLSNHDNQEVESWCVYVRGEYDRSTRKYICSSFDDVNHSRQFFGKTRVFVNFIF